MARLMATLVVVFGLSGCKLPHAVTDTQNILAPGLLIGPEAGHSAPTVELPTRDSAKLCLRTAAELEKTGQTENAIQLYEKARNLDPAAARHAGRRLAVLYDKAGDFTKSTAEYEALLKDGPKDADLLNDFGYSHYCRGNWADAETYLGRAVEAAPGNKKACMNLGLAQAQLGKWDDSYLTFCKAVRPADAHCNLGFLLAALGRTDDAKDQYRRALAIDPGLKLAHAALNQLENPNPTATAVKAAGGKGPAYDPVEAAAKVPSFEQIEARLKKEGKLPTVVATDDEPQPVKAE